MIDISYANENQLVDFDIVTTMSTEYLSHCRQLGKNYYRKILITHTLQTAGRQQSQPLPPES